MENALKLYQDALKLHYKCDWDGAFDAYDSLLASDVLQDVLHKVQIPLHREPKSTDQFRESIYILERLLMK